MKSESMNLDTIRTFVKLGQSESIEEAAKKLNMDASNVRRHVKALGETLGVKLLKGYTRGQVELTDIGNKLFNEYEKAYNMILLAEKKLEQSKSLDSGKLSVGCSSDYELTFLLEYIKKFKSKYPNVVIKVVNSVKNDLYKQLLSYSLDFIIDKKIEDNMKSHNFKSIKLLDNKYCFVYDPKFYSKAIKKDSPLIAPISSSSDRIPLNNYLENHDNFNIMYEVQNPEHVVEYAKQGLGYGFVSKIVADQHPELEQIVIPSTQAKSEIFVTYMTDSLSQSAKEFIKFLSE